MGMHFNISSNPNGLNPIDDETIDFGILGNAGGLMMNHLNISLMTDRVNHGLVSSHNNVVNLGQANHVKQESDLVSSMLISNGHLNYGVASHAKYGSPLTHVKQEPDQLVTSMSFSPTINHYSSSSSVRVHQNDWVSPPPGFAHQLSLGERVAQQMRRHILSTTAPARVQVENVIDCLPAHNRSDLTRVTVTQTVTKRYVATIPTSMMSVQNDIERVRRALACESSNLWNNPSHSDPHDVDHHVKLHGNIDHHVQLQGHEVHNHHLKHGEILNPKPFNVFVALDQHKNPRCEESPGHNHDEPLNYFSLPDQKDQNPGQDDENLDQHHNKINQIPRPVKYPQHIEYVDYYYDESDEEAQRGNYYDGRTHSLPCEKYGPYTCPKCNMVFETSQKFAAHMLASHYRFETEEQKKRRLRARYKKKFRLLNAEQGRLRINLPEWTGANRASPKIGQRVDEETRVQNQGGNINGIGVVADDNLFDVVVKEEPM